MDVVDAHGIKWLVKFGEEVRSQTFANRVAWALGYGALRRAASRRPPGERRVAA